MQFITLPGIGGSGAQHWQTYWEASDLNFQRISVENWNAPDLTEWLDATDKAVAEADKPCVLVAHSLSCLLAAEYIGQTKRQIAGAFLVAVPDPDAPPFPRKKASDFIDFYRDRLACPSVVVASRTDPFGTVEYAKLRAAEWGAELVEVGESGHINAMGDWPEGHRLLSAFRDGLLQT